MLEENTLDVTVLEPRQEYPTIFACFEFAVTTKYQLSG